MRLSVSLALLSAPLVFGQTQQLPSPAPEVKPEDKCIVEGQVISAVTGEPVKKAQLMLRKADGPGSPFAAASDAGGKFSIADIDPGKYRLSVTRTGFVSQQYGARGNSMLGTTLTLAPGDKLTGIVFKLIAHGVIAGRVVDEDGDPVANVIVQPMQYRYIRGKKQLMPTGQSVSNDLGEYRLYGLRPGKYVLMAGYRNMYVEPAASTRNAPEESYAPVYYPGSLEPSGAAPLTITPGSQLLNTDIRLVKTRAVRIRGRVIAPARNGMEGAAVFLMPRGAVMYLPGRPVARPDTKGNFELRGVTPGSYTIAVNYTGSNGERYQGRQPIDVGTSDIDNAQITVLSPISVPGHIRVEGQSTAHLREVHVTLEPGEGMGGSYATSDDDGNITFRDVSPDKFRVSVSAPAGLYAKSARTGDQDLMESELDLSSGSAGGDIEIVLSTAGGQADGSVTNDKGEPAAGVTITLVPEDPKRLPTTFLKTGTTDQYGRFSFKDIAPGDYLAYAWDQIEFSGMALDPDFVKPYEDKAGKLRIGENGHESLDLKLILTDPSLAQ